MFGPVNGTYAAYAITIHMRLYELEPTLIGRLLFVELVMRLTRVHPSEGATCDRWEVL